MQKSLSVSPSREPCGREPVYKTRTTCRCAHIYLTVLGSCPVEVLLPLPPLCKSGALLIELTGLDFQAESGALPNDIRFAKRLAVLVQFPDPHDNVLMTVAQRRKVLSSFHGGHGGSRTLKSCSLSAVRMPVPPRGYKDYATASSQRPAVSVAPPPHSTQPRNRTWIPTFGGWSRVCWTSWAYTLRHNRPRLPNPRTTGLMRPSTPVTAISRPIRL